MAATIKKSDVAEKASIVVEGSQVREVIRAFIVEGLDGTRALLDAVNAVIAADTTTGTGPLWSAHPTIGDMRVVSFTTEVIDSFRCYVLARYINTAAVLYRGSSGLVMSQTDKDITGTQIVLTHEGKSYPGVLQKLFPEGTFSISRIQPSLAYGGIDPVLVQNIYCGAVNATPFLGHAPRHVMCESVSYDNDGFGNVAWNMVYEFRIKDAGTVWDPEVVAINPDTGEPFVGLIPGQGRKIPYSYIALNLNDLLA